MGPKDCPSDAKAADYDASITAKDTYKNKKFWQTLHVSCSLPKGTGDAPNSYLCKLGLNITLLVAGGLGALVLILALVAFLFRSKR